MLRRLVFYVVLWIFLFTLKPLTTAANSECLPIEKRKIKVEGYISKKFRKERKNIIREFTQMSGTRTLIRAFPMGKTSDVVAVGRCVPAHIARHVLKTAIKYTSGIGSLVVQDFVHGHWIGIGTTIFDEPSQQKVTAEQVRQLLNPDLDDKKFHALYQKLSSQNKLVPYFGLKVPNAKIPGNTNSTILSP